MGKIEKTALIKAPLERVWTLIEDVEKYPSYFTFIKDVKVTYHPKGERVCNCEGVKGIPVFEVAGRRMELEMLDVEHIHHKKSVRRSTSGMYFENIFLTDTTDEGVNLQWSVSYKLPYGILGTIMDMTSFSKEMDKHMVRSIDNIRNALEQKVVN